MREHGVIMQTRSTFTALISITLLAACAPARPLEPTPDVNAIRTSAAFTVVAEFTLTAAAFSPTPFPTDTPAPEQPTPTSAEEFTTDPTLAALGTPAELCDDFSFVADVTIPDGTPMTPGQEFVKTWKIRNTGSCAWGDGYKLIYSYSEKMSGKAVPLGVLVQSGEEVEVSVNFIAPTKVGEYTSAWQMMNPTGYPFGSKENILYVKIVIQ